MKSHRPTRRQAIIFFFFTIALVVMIIVWVFIINKGTLSVNGPTPFTIKAGGKSVECALSPCSIKLKPRKYTVSIQKDDYYNDTQTVAVVRGETAELNAVFKLIPVLREVGEMILPNDFVPLLGRFIGVKSLQNFPQTARDAIFSRNGDMALVKLGKEVYIYNVEAGSLNKTGLKASQNFDWTGNNVAVLDSADTETEQNLFLVSDITGKETSKLIAVFKRAFADPRVLGSPDGKKVLITDYDDTDTKYAHYVVDLEKTSRTKLEISDGAKAIKWVGNFIIFEDEFGKAVAMDGETLKTIELAAIDAKNITSFPDGRLVFVTEFKHGPEDSTLGISISEAVQEAKRETQNDNGGMAEIVYITEFDAETFSTQSLVEVRLRNGEEIKRLTADSSKNRIYFEKDGKLFEVVLD